MSTILDTRKQNNKQTTQIARKLTPVFHENKKENRRNHTKFNDTASLVNSSRVISIPGTAVVEITTRLRTKKLPH